MAERTKNGPYWVKAWIADLSQLTDMFRDEDGKVDYEALGREEYQFRMALARKDFSISVRAKKVWDEAIGPYQQRIGAARKDKESTAGAPTREDGVNLDGTHTPTKAEARTPATISQDASTRKGEDDSKAPTSCTVSSKEPVVLNLAYSGEFGNVTLTQEQYNSLLQKFGNKTACDRAIDSLSAKLENGELKARSHYAVLVKWANYRNDKADERNDDGETYLEKNWRKALNNVGMNL